MAVFRDFPRTLLPIDRWAQLLGIDPRHFRQVETEAKPNSSCASVWKQYSWQEADQVGRFDVADAIQQAEKAIAQRLNYKLLPTWEVDERIQTPKPSAPELLRFNNINPRGFSLTVEPHWGHFVEGGVETKVIEPNGSGVAVTYSDVDGDDYFETATISFATTVTDEEELAVFYPGEGGADKWEIRPLNTVSISGGTAIITMSKEKLVQPDLIEALNPTAVVAAGVAVDANFLDTVDVYRRFNNPDGQLTLIWDPNRFLCGACGGTATTCCPVCGQTTQEGCLSPQDYRSSRLMYRAATFDDDTESFVSADLTCNRNPDQLLMNYRAGLEDKSLARPKLQMDPQWERAVAVYALTLLDRPLCGCAPLEALSTLWSQDLSQQSSEGSSFQVSDDLLNNPLGMTRAAVRVWAMIREEGRRVGHAVRW